MWMWFIVQRKIKKGADSEITQDFALVKKKRKKGLKQILKVWSKTKGKLWHNKKAIGGFSREIKFIKF